MYLWELSHLFIASDSTSTSAVLGADEVASQRDVEAQSGSCR